jgi:hypothetical protein
MLKSYEAFYDNGTLSWLGMSNSVEKFPVKSVE